MVPCTDLHRVPDSESTSALVSHIWPSSARTRCCSCCHRSRKPSRTTGRRLQWAHFSMTSSRLVQSVLMGKKMAIFLHAIFKGFVFWKHISGVLKITRSFQRYVVSFMRQDFNYSLKKQWKEAILMLLMVLLMMYFSSQREVQKTQALLLKGCFVFLFFF